MSKPNVTRVQSATERTASVHTLHMSKPNVTRVQITNQPAMQPASLAGRPANTVLAGRPGHMEAAGRPAGKTAGRPAGWQGAGRPAGDEIANKSTVLSCLPKLSQPFVRAAEY